MSTSSEQREFADLLEQCQRPLLHFVLSLVPSHADALDVLQETAAELWRKFGKFDRQRPFEPWARKFAYLQVLKYREEQARKHWKLIRLDNTTLEAIAGEYELHEEIIVLRQAALVLCIKKLTEEEASLLESRYWESDSIRDVARAAGVDEQTLYRQLQRIRLQLQKCIEATIARGDV